MAGNECGKTEIAFLVHHRTELLISEIFLNMGALSPAPLIARCFVRR